MKITIFIRAVAYEEHCTKMKTGKKRRNCQFQNHCNSGSCKPVKQPCFEIEGDESRGLLRASQPTKSSRPLKLLPLKMSKASFLPWFFQHMVVIFKLNGKHVYTIQIKFYLDIYTITNLNFLLL
jgi:hypothetical protein